MSICLGWQVDHSYDDGCEFPREVESTTLHRHVFQVQRAGVGPLCLSTEEFTMRETPLPLPFPNATIQSMR